MTESVDDILNNTIELLENERAALLSGDLARISEMTEQKAAFCEQMVRSDRLNFRSLDNISQRLQGNRGLIAQAMLGIESVILRIKDLQKAQGQLETYDRKGSKLCTNLYRPSVERRS